MLLRLNYVFWQYSTGSGDVDTSKVVKADEDGCIVGVSGLALFFCFLSNEDYIRKLGAAF
jgi:hypothetical protein